MNSWLSTSRSMKACVSLGVLLAGLAGTFFRTSAAAEGADEPVPPPDATVVREVQAGGAQVYACRSAADGTFSWVLLGPKAILVNADGSDFGTHSVGPTWTATDGSSIAADATHPLAKFARPQSVPALLLRVTASHGGGVLSGVRFVRRTGTDGGLPPTSGCDAGHVNASVAVHYSAVYTFYR